MRIGEFVGVICGVAGLGAGLYFGVSPVVTGLQAGHITAEQAGYACGFFGAATGLVCACWGVIYNHERQST